MYSRERLLHYEENIRIISRIIHLVESRSTGSHMLRQPLSPPPPARSVSAHSPPVTPAEVES